MASLVVYMEYLNVFIGKEAKDAAWYYPDTVTERAEKIKDHVAFCEFSFGFFFHCLMLIRIDKTKVDVKVE